MPEEEQVVHYEFEEGFERQLLALLIRDREFYVKHQGYCETKYFASQIRRDIWELSREYLEKYIDQSLTYDILANEINHLFYKLKKKNVNIDDYLEEAALVFTADITTGKKYTSDEVLEFARSQQMKIVLTTAAKRVKTRQDLRPIANEVMKALNIGENLNLAYDYFDETITRTTRLYGMSENHVGTGCRKLDRFLGGGLAGGEMGIVVGPPSRGKTAALVNLAVGAMLNRKNVIYFGLEGAERDVAIRFDMRISRINKDLLVKEFKQVQETVTYFHNLLKSTLLIKMYAQEDATVADMDQYLIYEEMARGFKPDIIFIDYLNLCKRPNQRDDNWMGRTYREGKGLATRRNLPLWSAVQAKMDSLKSNIVLPQHIAEATGRVWADSDVIIGLCQTDDQAKTHPMEMSWYLGKNRNRPAKRRIPMIFDSDIMLIEEDKRVSPQATAQATTTGGAT